MRRKTWSSVEAPDTLRVQALREMPVGGEGGLPDLGGEGGVNIGGGEGSGTSPSFLTAGGEGGGEGGGGGGGGG